MIGYVLSHVIIFKLHMFKNRDKNDCIESSPSSVQLKEIRSWTHPPLKPRHKKWSCATFTRSFDHIRYVYGYVNCITQYLITIFSCNKFELWVPLPRQKPRLDRMYTNVFLHKFQILRWLHTCLSKRKHVIIFIQRRK